MWLHFSNSFTVSTAGTYKIAFSGTVSSTTLVDYFALDYVNLISQKSSDNSSLNIYRNATANSLNINYSYNTRTFVDTKLLDYSANRIYDIFINVGKYGLAPGAAYKAFAYDSSKNLVGNQVNWMDASNASIFSDLLVGRHQDPNSSTAVYKGKIYRLNLITPNTSYYTFDASGGTDYTTTADYYTTNATGENSTYL
jgi:hypothetical protein